MCGLSHVDNDHWASIQSGIHLDGAILVHKTMCAYAFYQTPSTSTYSYQGFSVAALSLNLSHESNIVAFKKFSNHRLDFRSQAGLLLKSHSSFFCVHNVYKKAHNIFVIKKRSSFLIMANRFHVFTYQMKPFPSIIIMANRKSVTEALIIGDVLIPTSLGLILPITACPRRMDITWKTISHCFNILWKV